MVGKQVIIDGCPYQGECSISGCKRNDDGCFVRQLFEERDRAEKQIIELNKTIQAKEQECERWKNANDEKNELLAKLGCPTTATARRKEFTLQQQLDQLKAENDTLRQFLSKEPLALQALQSGYTSYKKSSDVLYEMVKQYKQALTEIKEIAEKHKVTAHCDYLTDMDNTIQKISECGVGND